MKRLKKPFLSAFLAFFIGAIMTYLDEPKTVELKGAIFGGFKFSIIMLVITIVTDNFSSFNKKKNNSLEFYFNSLKLLFIIQTHFP